MYLSIRTHAFVFGYPLVVYLSLSEIAITFSFVSFCVLRTWLGKSKVGAPKIQTERKANCTLFEAGYSWTRPALRGIVSVFVSSGCVWEWLWILGGINFYTLLCTRRYLVCPWGCLILPRIYIYIFCPSWKMTRYLKVFCWIIS